MTLGGIKQMYEISSPALLSMCAEFRLNLYVSQKICSLVENPIFRANTVNNSPNVYLTPGQFNALCRIIAKNAQYNRGMPVREVQLWFRTRFSNYIRPRVPGYYNPDAQVILPG